MYLISSLLVELSISPYNMKCLCEKKSGKTGRSSEPEEMSPADSACTEIKHRSLKILKHGEYLNESLDTKLLISSSGGTEN